MADDPQGQPYDPPIEYGSKGSLGLQDGRVEICRDRGNRAFADDNKHLFTKPERGSIPTWNPQAGKTACEVIRRDLQNAQVRLNRNHRQMECFVPRSDILKIMTLPKIRAAIRSLECCRTENADNLAFEVCFGRGSVCRLPCVRVFAVLISIREQERLLDVLKSGISDECLPMELDARSGIVTCQGHGDGHPIRLEDDNFMCKQFCQASRSFSSPYIKGVPGKHVHMVLDKDDVLPFLTKHQLRNWSDTLCQGGFGEVYAVEIHGDHFNFDELGLPKGLRKFAIKTLFDHDKESFNLELASLLPFQPFPTLNLIQVLATFEILDADGVPTFYFLFPFADGNLWDLFKLVDSTSERTKRTAWMASQCAALANALRLIHNERAYHIPHLTTIINRENMELYGRHGDIKADNILYFLVDGDYRLVITDFGLGRLHTGISRSLQNPTGINNSSTYRAPEFDAADGKISRKSDIYSLGCVFLEFVTWYLDGYESAQTKFTKARMEPNALRPSFVEDTFFGLRRGGDGRASAIRKSKVTDWIRELRSDRAGSAYTDQFLDLIEGKMLEPDVGRRATSMDICKELEHMAAACRRDSDYIKPKNSQIV